jgi:copper-containing nitrite reductase
VREPHLELPVEDHPLIFAPKVPPPISRSHPVKLKITIPVTIEEVFLDAERIFEYWTFGGKVPGPFIRGRVGDILDVTMQNRDDTGMQHNIDFHAVLGTGGGAEVLTADSNESARGMFQLTHPGLFYYHCSVGPVGEHVGRGMYGLILVEPEQGLPPVDHEYYVMQSEFYLSDKPDYSLLNPGSKVYQTAYEASLSENPTHVVFNGHVGSLVGEKSLRASVGDSVRFFVGNAGPNLVSSFHIIGGIFDRLFREGDLVSPPARSIQTTLIPSGGAAVVEMDLKVPGKFTLVDHSIWRIEKGCVGFLEVDGKNPDDIFWSEGPPKPCEGCVHH